jgi:NYN domain
MDFSNPVSSPIKHRVAILIDGDNFPPTGLLALESQASRFGEVTIRRVFGDMTLQKGWAIQTSYTVTHCTTAAGKNRADMALVVAAMDFAHRGLATAFVIVSDDRDFGPLVSHLSEQGYRVDWVGKPKPPAAKPAEPAAKPAALSSLDKKLIQTISSQADASTGVPLVRLGHLMKGDTVKVQTEKASWRAYLKEKPALFLLEGVGAAGCVRLKV